MSLPAGTRAVSEGGCADLDSEQCGRRFPPHLVDPDCLTDTEVASRAATAPTRSPYARAFGRSYGAVFAHR